MTSSPRLMRRPTASVAAEGGLWWRDPLGWGLALWGATVAVLGFPPAPVWPLALVAPGPLWAAVLVARPRRAFARGWLYGFGFFTGLVWWIAPTVVRYGGLPVPAGVACLLALAGYLALYPAAGAAAVAAAARRRPALGLAVAPLAWTALEGLRAVALSGFPWGDLPQALWRVDAALRLAPWVGIDGVRLLVAGLASGVAWGLARLGGGPRVSRAGLLPAAAAAAAWAILAALPPPGAPPAGRARVAVVQGDIEQAQKWDPAFRDRTLKIYATLSRAVAVAGQGGASAAAPEGSVPGAPRRAEARPPATEGPVPGVPRRAGARPSAREGEGAAADRDHLDLLLWPETAVPLYAQDPGPERLRVEHLATELDTWLAFGAPAYVRRGGSVEYRNAVFLMSPAGRVAGRYDKVHLVPFGEYVPFGKYLPFLKKLVTGAGDFTGGERVAPLRGGPGLPVLGPLVCFEMIFPSLATAHAERGAQLLVVVTNDGWFGATPGPYQHLAFAAWRAAETRLPLVRAANTGVSAAFDARGRLVRATALGTRDAFAVRLTYPEPHVTPQSRVRPWVTPTSGALAVVGLFAILRRFRNEDLPAAG